MAKANILVVEDETIIALDIQDALQGLGYDVCGLTASGEQAIQLATELKPDLALMDIHLSGEMDGTQAAGQIQSRLDIPVVYLTAHSNRATLERARLTQPFGYVLKPFKERELHMAIEIALYRHQMERLLQAREAEIRRRNRELATLNQVISASAASTTAEPMLETACRELAQALDLPHVAVSLLNEDKTASVVVAEYRTQNWPSALQRVTPAPEWAPTHPMSLNGTDAPAAPRMVLPMVIQGEVIGGLELSTAEPHDFSGEEIDLGWSVSRQVAGALARMRAEEKRRKLEQQYYQAQKMEALGRLTGGVAHEFNNLLTIMNGFTEFLQLELPPDSRLQELTTKIGQAGRRATNLVRQLLAFSRAQVIQPQVTDLNRIVTDMYDMLWRIIGEDITMTSVLAPNLWTVMVDPAQMELVIINLVINARDAMPYGGRLSLETANVVLEEDQIAARLDVQSGEHVMLSVSDTGMGMSEQVRARIFEPFFTTKQAGAGTGLGLSTVHGVVKQSGGDILCYSEEGVGTTFKIYLPRNQGAVRLCKGPRLTRALPVGGETLLVVEDDPGVRELAGQVLRQGGYTLLEAETASEALGVASGHAGPIHLLLTDLVLPGTNGKALAGQLARSRPEMKTLFMSGYSSEVIAHHGLLEPGAAFLVKPFGPSDLACKVRSILDA
jgi:two-component system cell cycle sensor histidine kinase/response regulator CckA